MTYKPMPRISLLALLFGIGSWVAITGFWLEVPLLLQRLPEGWALASQLNVMIQLANVAPIAYWLGHRYGVANEITAIHTQMFIGLMSCVMLMLFWDVTITIKSGDHSASSEHSIILFVASFGLGVVDCTSSVTFLPFIARFDRSYMTPYLVGEGLSGLIPSMIALAQGVGDERESKRKCPTNETITTTSAEVNIDSGYEHDAKHNLIKPRFSVEVFFLSLFLTILVSYIAFLCLNYIGLCKREMQRALHLRLQRNPSSLVNIQSHQTTRAIHDDDEINNNSDDHNEIHLVAFNVHKDTNTIKGDEDDHGDDQNEIESQKAMVDNHRTYYYLLGLMFFNCFITFGFIPGLQPYSALPYGADILHYVVILSGIAYPVGCFYGMLFENKSIRVMNLLTLLGTCLGLYITFCGLMSPVPPLVKRKLLGGTVMIVVYTLLIGILSYTKTMITLWICDYNSTKGMFWVGMHTQFGAAFGAMLMFALINYTHFFNQCSPIA